MAVRRITAGKRDLIRQLSDILGGFLPLTSYAKNTVTFQTIFAESKVCHYLDGTVKKKALQNAWEQVFRSHPRLPYTLIRKIVPAAIDYRRHKRNPLKQTELTSLIECLERLDVDMRRELERITIDERVPEIRVAPQELFKRLESHPLVPEVASEPLELFRNGHFNESVRKAAEKFEAVIQKRTALSDIGQKLMAKVFNLPAPVIALNDLSSENKKGVQEGYMHMTMGLMRGIRNIFSHGDENQRAPEECYEMMLFINWLFKQLP